MAMVWCISKHKTNVGQKWAFDTRKVQGKYQEGSEKEMEEIRSTYSFVNVKAVRCGERSSLPTIQGLGFFLFVVA